ncbi:PLA2G12A (predicted) [Pycnogonum litorale]
MKPTIICVELVAHLIIHFSLIYTSAFLDDAKHFLKKAGHLINEVGHEIDRLATGLETVSGIIDSAIDEDCEFACPEGTRMKKNVFHEPVSNGCGSFGISLDAENLPVKTMTKCCDQHDLCYSVCFSDRDICDLKFKKCLYGSCKVDENDISSLDHKQCKAVAKMLYLGTLALGCKAFQNAQEDACVCEPNFKPHKDHSEL